MSEQHYDIFFRGEVLDGFELDAVKTQVGQLFKAPPEKVEQLFSGKVIPLKKDLDKATAAKFKQALEKAGAKIYIKLAAESAPVSAAKPVPPAAAITSSPQAPALAIQVAVIAEDNAPLPVAEATISDETPTEFIILPPGSDVLRKDERTVIEPVKVDISGIRMASVFDQPEIDKVPPPRAPDVSHLSTAAVGADILAGVKKEPPPPAPAVDHISIAEGDFNLSELVEKVPVPPAPDVSHISTAAPGSDILEGVKKAPVPQAPDVSHIRLAP
jgi:hypothetical protein